MYCLKFSDRGAIRISFVLEFKKGFPSGSVVKNLPADPEDTGDAGLIPGWGRSPGEENGNPLQYSCPENSMDRGAWQGTVHEVTKSHLARVRTSAHTHRQTHTHTHMSPFTREAHWENLGRGVVRIWQDQETWPSQSSPKAALRSTWDLFQPRGPGPLSGISSSICQGIA